MACSEDGEKTVEGILSRKLHSAFATTCEKFIESIKFSHMKKDFKEIYDKNPKALKNIHEQLCSQLRKSITEDLNDLSKEYSIDFMLNSLEAIKKKQVSSEKCWRPSGDPTEDLRDHIYPLKLKHKEDLQAILSKLEQSNEELMDEVSVNHAEILLLKQSCDDMSGEFNNIISSLNGKNLESLQETLHSVIEET